MLFSAVVFCMPRQPPLSDFFYRLNEEVSRGGPRGRDRF